MVTGHALEKVINGPAHHTLHHLYFTVNYGQVRLTVCAFCGYLLKAMPSTLHGLIVSVVRTASRSRALTPCSRSRNNHENYDRDEPTLSSIDRYSSNIPPSRWS